ncbi:metallophosphoesterase [Patescibacteria group bacterium]
MPSLPFEIVIATVAAVVPLFLVEAAYRWQKIQAKGVYVLLGAALFVVWAVVVYGSFVEPRFLTVERQQLLFGEGQRHLRVALVADTHLGRYRHDDWVRRLVGELNEIEPDVVLLLGDIVDSERGLKSLQPLDAVRSTYGTYAVLGNSDYHAGAVDVRHEIERWRVEVLTNESVALGDSGVRLVGIDDLWFGTPRYGRAFAEVEDDEMVILAAHNPDAAGRGEYYGADLLVAGHTHGGQIRLPLIGPVPELPTELGRQYDRGLFDYGQMKLYITSGAGESGPRARFLEPPEIAVLEIDY